MSTQWVKRFDRNHVPTEEGWYRVMIPGDSESVDGYELYSFPDYEQWAYWTPAGPGEYEDFDGGYKGQFNATFDEESDSIFAWCGPFNPPSYKE